MYEVPSVARAVIGWGPARATELVCGYRYFPLSAEGGIPAAGRECSMLLLVHVRSILRGERVEQGLGSHRVSAESVWSVGEEQSRAEQSKAGTGHLFARREYGTGLLHLGRLSRGKLPVAREGTARPDTWRIRRGPSWVLFYFCLIYFCPRPVSIDRIDVGTCKLPILSLCHLQV